MRRGKSLAKRHQINSKNVHRVLLGSRRETCSVNARLYDLGVKSEGQPERPHRTAFTHSIEL